MLIIPLSRQEKIIVETEIIKEKELVVVELIEKEIEYAETELGTEWEVFEATAYTSLDEGCNEISSLGINIYELHEHINIVAVDPKIIPLGSLVIIDIAYDEDDLEKEPELISAIAFDIGGAIKENKLDIYFGYDLTEAFNFGRRNVLATYIERGQL